MDEYWGPSPGHVFDWRGLTPRENQLKSQLEVRVQDKVTSRIDIVHFFNGVTTIDNVLTFSLLKYFIWIEFGSEVVEINCHMEGCDRSSHYPKRRSSWRYRGACR